jgi:hypothetical protein
MPFSERMQVTAEIGEQDVLAELFQRRAGVTRQPILDDFFLGFHIFSQI